MSRMPRPSSAAATAFTPMAAPKIHSDTVTAKANAVIFSSVDNGPATLHHKSISPTSDRVNVVDGCYITSGNSLILRDLQL